MRGSSFDKTASVKRSRFGRSAGARGKLSSLRGHLPSRRAERFLSARRGSFLLGFSLSRRSDRNERMTASSAACFRFGSENAKQTATRPSQARLAVLSSELAARVSTAEWTSRFRLVEAMLRSKRYRKEKRLGAR